MVIEVLPTYTGESILIIFKGDDNKNHSILIDGGPNKSYSNVKRIIFNKLSEYNCNLDLVIITHTDNDHIRGVLNFFSDRNFPINKIHKIIFNSALTISKLLSKPTIQIEDETVNEMPEISNEISIREGIKLENYLQETSIWKTSPTLNHDEINLFGAKLKFLSPVKDSLEKLYKYWKNQEGKLKTVSKTIYSKQGDYDYNYLIKDLYKNPDVYDTSVTNRSSIAFILEIGDKKGLFLSDAHIDVINSSIKELYKSFPVNFDIIKLSHHCSKKNIDTTFLNQVSSNKFIVTADGSRKYFHPNKEALSKIILNQKRKLNEKIEFFYNHKNSILDNIFQKDIAVENIFKKYNFENIFPKNNSDGNVIKL